jgi:MFS family permease
MTCNLLASSISGVIGATLAPTVTWGTLPFSLLLAGTTIGILPAGRFMAQFGRRAALFTGALVGSAGGALSCVALSSGSLVLFSAGAALLGVAAGFAAFYRFAAVHLIDSKYHAHVHSAFVAAGVIASIAGPAIAEWTYNDGSTAPYAGAYVAVAAMFIITAALIALMTREEWSAKGTRTAFGSNANGVPAQDLTAVVGTAANAVSVASMTALMVSLPLLGHVHGMHTSATTSIMQLHFIAMYAPGLITGPLVNRLGAHGSIGAGTVLALLGTAAALVGDTATLLKCTLVASGLSWALIAVAAATAISRFSSPRLEARLGFYVSLGSAVVSFGVNGALDAFGWRGINAAAGFLFVCLLAAVSWSWMMQRKSMPAPATSLGTKGAV